MKHRSTFNPGSIRFPIFEQTLRYTIFYYQCQYLRYIQNVENVNKNKMVKSIFYFPNTAEL